MIGVSRQTIRSYMQRGLIKYRLLQIEELPEYIKKELPAIRKRQVELNGMRVIDSDEIERWNQEKTIALGVVEPPWITIKEASQQFNISMGTLRAAIRNRRLATIVLTYSEALVLFEGKNKPINKHTHANIYRRGIMVTSFEAVELYLQSRARKPKM